MGPLIDAALEDPESEVRQAATEALSWLRRAGALELLIAALEDPGSEVRQAAAEALGRLKDARVVKPLIATLMDPAPGVRGAAAEALGKLKEKSAEEPLEAMLGDSDENVLEKVAVALTAMGNSAGQEALERIEDRRWGLHLRMASTLLQTGKATCADCGSELWPREIALRAEMQAFLGALGVLPEVLRGADQVIASGSAVRKAIDASTGPHLLHIAWACCAGGCTRIYCCVCTSGREQCICGGRLRTGLGWQR